MLAEITVDLRSLRTEIKESEDVKKLYRFEILFMLRERIGKNLKIRKNVKYLKEVVKIAVPGGKYITPPSNSIHLGCRQKILILS